jgi:hypothetical protein
MMKISGYLVVALLASAATAGVLVLQGGASTGSSSVASEKIIYNPVNVVYTDKYNNSGGINYIEFKPLDLKCTYINLKPGYIKDLYTTQQSILCNRLSTDPPLKLDRKGKTVSKSLPSRYVFIEPFKIQVGFGSAREYEVPRAP